MLRRQLLLDPLDSFRMRTRKSNHMIRILKLSTSSSPFRPPWTAEGLDVEFNHVASDLISHVYIMKPIKTLKNETWRVPWWVNIMMYQESGAP